MTNAKFTVIIIMLLYNTHRSTAQDLSWPRLEFHPGEDAHLPCIAKGDPTGFFWRKGDSFESSTPIVYKFEGLPSQSEDGWKDKFSILEDGTLIVYRVSQEDEGKYFCRIVSESSECHAGVTLSLKVKTDDFSLRIEECSSMKSCVIPAEYYEPLTLTCAAYKAPSSTTLKWFNGPTEIPDSLSTLNVINTGQGINMTKRLVLEHPWSSLLSCKATSESIPEKSACICTYVIPTQNNFPDDTSSWSIILFVLFLVLLLILSTCIGIMYYKGLQEERKKCQDPEKNENEESKTLLQVTATDSQTKPKVRRGLCLVKLSAVDRFREENNQLKQRIGELSVEKVEQGKKFRSKINELPEQIETAESNCEVFKILSVFGSWLYQIQQLQEKIEGLEHLNDEVRKIATTLGGKGKHPPGDQETPDDMVNISEKIKTTLNKKIHDLSSKIEHSEEKDKIRMVLKEMGQWYTGIQDHPISSIPGIKTMTIDALDAALEGKILDLSEKVKNAKEMEEITKVVSEFSTWQTVIQDHKRSTELPNAPLSEMLTDITALQNVIKDHKDNFPGLRQLPSKTFKAALDEKMSNISETIKDAKKENEMDKVLKEVAAWHTATQSYESTFQGIATLPSKTLTDALEKKMNNISAKIETSGMKEDIEKVLKEVSAWHTATQSYESTFQGIATLPSKTLTDALEKKMNNISTEIETSVIKEDIEKVLKEVAAWHTATQDYKSTFKEIATLPSKTLTDALEKKMNIISAKIETSVMKEDIEKVLKEVAAWHTATQDYKSTFKEIETLPSKTLTDALEKKMNNISGKIETSDVKEDIKKVLKEVAAWHTATQDYKSTFKEIEALPLKTLKDALVKKMNNISAKIENSDVKEDIEKVLKEVTAWHTATQDYTSTFKEIEILSLKSLKDALEKKMNNISGKIKTSDTKEDIEKVLAEIEAWHTVLQNYQRIFSEHKFYPSQTLKSFLDEKITNLLTSIKGSEKSHVVEVLREINAWRSTMRKYEDTYPEFGNLLSTKLKATFNEEMSTRVTTIKDSGNKDEIKEVVSKIDDWQKVIQDHVSTNPELENFQKAIEKRKATLMTELADPQQ